MKMEAIFSYVHGDAERFRYRRVVEFEIVAGGSRYLTARSLGHQDLLVLVDG